MPRSTCCFTICPAILRLRSSTTAAEHNVATAGGTDFPGSDWETLVASIRMLLDALPPDTVVYPGHGPTTTLGTELARNPFLAELRAERAG